MTPFQSRRQPGKLLDSANPSPSVRLRAPDPGLPIRPGSTFFRPWRIWALLAIAAAIWLLSYSGVTGLSL